MPNGFESTCRLAAELFKEKCNRVYNHVYDAYFGPDDNIYTRAA